MKKFLEELQKSLTIKHLKINRDLKNANITIKEQNDLIISKAIVEAEIKLVADIYQKYLAVIN